MQGGRKELRRGQPNTSARADCACDPARTFSLEKSKNRRSRISFAAVVISLKYTPVFIMAEAEQRLQHDPVQFDGPRV
jgi:hypothetical protein